MENVRKTNTRSFAITSHIQGFETVFIPKVFMIPPCLQIKKVQLLVTFAKPLQKKLSVGYIIESLKNSQKNVVTLLTFPVPGLLNLSWIHVNYCIQVLNFTVKAKFIILRS